MLETPLLVFQENVSYYIMASYYSAHIHHRWRSTCFNIQYFPAMYFGATFFKDDTDSLPYHQLMVNNVLWRNTRPIKPGTLGRTPSLFDKCTGLFYTRYTSHSSYGFLSHSKDTTTMVKCFAKGQRCHNRDSYPHSAEQKHQSLSPRSSYPLRAPWDITGYSVCFKLWAEDHCE